MATSLLKPIYDAYFAGVISIPNDSAPHQIFALMKAINPTAPYHCKYFTIQSVPAGSLVSTANALIGESALDNQGATNPSKLTSTNFGVILVPGASETFGGWWDEFNNIARYWVINDGTGTGVVSLAVQAVRG